MAARRTTRNTVEETNPVVEETVSEEIGIEELATESVTAEETAEETKEESAEPVNRIPEMLASQFILNNFCQRYLNELDAITAYNKSVMAEKDSEWNPAKVLVKARELGTPDSADVEANEEIKKALDIWEDLVAQSQKAKRDVIELTSKALGISLSSVAAERNLETEAKLKENRKIAVVIGEQLKQMATLTNDAATTEVVMGFLNANQLPAVGRDQVRNFGSDTGGTTPKYRVGIVVKRDNETIISADGFTKLALALPPYYERGKSPKSPMFREIWEKAGNSPEKTVQSVVEFEDNGLHFIMTKK